MTGEPEHTWLAMFQVWPDMDMPNIGPCIGLLLTPPMTFVIIGAFLSALTQPQTPPSAREAMLAMAKDLFNSQQVRDFAEKDEHARTFYNRFSERFGSFKLTGEN